MSASVLWTPHESAYETSGLARFCAMTRFHARDYETLHRWSISDKGAFWRAVWDFTSVVGEPGEIGFVSHPSAPMTGATFFPDAKINMAENLLKGANRPAVIEVDETGHFAKFDLDEFAPHATSIQIKEAVT